MSAIPSAHLIQNTRIFDSQLCEKNGVKRIYLESNRLNGTRFEPGVKIAVEKQRKRIVITPADGDTKNAVSRRRTKPVIDIYNKEITEAFSGVDEIKVIVSVDRIVIEALEENVKQNAARSKFKQKRFYTMSEMFGGGGTLAKAFKDEGFIPVTVIEREERYIQNYERNFPGVTSYCMDVRKVDYSKLPHTDIAVIGIPCDKHSQLFTTNPNNKDSVAEAGDTGYLTHYALRFIEAIRPAVLIVEVEPYSRTDASMMLRTILSQMGYSLTETVSTGSRTKRKRWALVAHMGEPVSLDNLIADDGRVIGDFLETPVEERKWQTADENLRVAGMIRKGLGIRAVTPNDKMVNSFTTHGTRHTEPLLKHPTKELYSEFSNQEIANLHGLDSYKLSGQQTLDRRILGQGVTDMFYHVALRVKSTLEAA